MSEKQFTAYISKYALTQGILKKHVELCSTSGNMVQVVGARWAEYYHGEGVEWHRSLFGAVERAEVLRENKLRSLQKQKARIEAMVFDVEKS